MHNCLVHWGQVCIFAFNSKEKIMTDYEYIMGKCREYHFTKWNEDELRRCQEVLPNLTREELVSIYRSRLLSGKDPLKQTAFKVLFADKVGKREERIKNMDIDDLTKEFKDKNSGNRALIRKELRDRYKAGRDKQMIIMAFQQSTKGDQHWITSQIRQERYGYRYNKYSYNK